MAFTQRTVNCGVLRPEHAGTEVVLNGWVHKRRDFGSVTFLDIRDRYGINEVETIVPSNYVLSTHYQKNVQEKS